MPAKISLNKKRFARLIVLKEIAPQLYPNSKKQRKFLCRCDCGNKIEVTGSHLKTGHTKSCGCLKEEKNHSTPLTHGHAKIGQHSPTYETWCGMKTRCTNSNQLHWKDYGGRGIEICREWSNSFKSFLADMGERPKGMTLDRIDNNLGYFKQNCEWRTQKQQQRNRRDTVFYTACGITGCLPELCEILGLDPRAVRARIHQCKWSVEKAFSTPIKTRTKNPLVRV